MKYKFNIFFYKLIFCFFIIKSIIKNYIYTGNENEYHFSPKISIYLPIYNKEKYITKSLKSIQMQSLKNIEILAINDNSTDNTLNILNNMRKKDRRIKIFNNYRNYGLLYTRSIGILKSSGEYIMNLDPDDGFANKNNLKFLYNIAKKLQLDVISFGYSQNNKYDIKCNNYNRIIKQPLIFNNSFSDKNYELLKINKGILKNEKDLILDLTTIVNYNDFSFSFKFLFKLLIFF